VFIAAAVSWRLLYETVDENELDTNEEGEEGEGEGRHAQTGPLSDGTDELVV
jgi:hypothetical protein